MLPRRPLLLVLLPCLLVVPASPRAAAIADVYALAGGDGKSPQPLFLDLVVNQVRREPVLVELLGEDVWAGVDDLRLAGLVDLRGARRSSGGRELVSLRSLAPELRFAIDDATLVLDVTASAALLGRKRLDLSPNARPADAVYSSVPSGFLNYAARLDDEGDVGGTGEIGVSLGRGDLLLSGVTIQPGSGDVVRGLTTLTVDRPERLLRFDAGDVVAGASGLGGGAVLLGAAAGRDFSLDPYFVQAPLPELEAFAATPSTVEVWVNGQLMRRETVMPGTYDLSNLPTTAGTNDVRVLVKDAFGRTQTLEASRYLGARLLAPGLHDFAVSAGFRREALGTESFQYGGPALFARERFGLTDRVTLGARFEAARALASGGVSVDAVFPVGEVQAEVAASAAGGRAGGAAMATWNLRRPRFNAGVFFRWNSPRYANVSLPAEAERELVRTGLLASVYAARRLTLSGELGTIRRRDAARENVLDLRATYGLGRGHTVSLQSRTSFTPDRRADFALFAGVTFAVGRGATADMSAGGRADGTGLASIGLQRSLPPGPGYGYRVQAASSGRQGQGSAVVEAQSELARAEATFDQIGATRTGTLSVAGGVVAMREGLFLTRPVEQSFALVEVSDVPGVRTYLENHPMGTTDGSGRLLIPSIGAFRANRISIADGDVPMDRTVVSREMLVIPPRRAGALARFAAERLSAVTGRLRVLVAGELAPPAGGMLRLGLDARRVLSSPIGADGNFWLEGVPPGDHAAEIFWRGRLCRFSISVPDERGVLDLGELGCGTRPRSLQRELTPAEQDVLSGAAPNDLPPPERVPPGREVAASTR